MSALERMPTGIPGLDHLLHGGIVRGNSLLIEGPPGSGKTTLAIRMVYEGVVQYDEPGLIITFEEFPRQIYEEALAYGVDLAALERSGKLRVVWTPPTRILEGFRGKNDLVEKLVHDLKVRRVAVDSITHFKRVAVAEAELREVLAEILNYLKLQGINAFLVKELERIDDSTIAFEEYLVDASMRVYSSNRASGGENLRYLEVRKTRGQSHVSGRHPFVLGDRGIQVYPALRPVDVLAAFGRMAPTGSAHAAESPSASARVSTGIPGLDEMLSGGFWSGTLNLVRGFPGTGKSALASHFLDAGVRAGERCLLVSLGDTPARIRAQVASLGMDWSQALQSGQMQVLHFQPVGLVHEQMLNTLVEAVRANRPRRLVLDSIDDVGAVVKDVDRLRDFLQVLVALIESADITAVVLEESMTMGGVAAEGRLDHSSVASCALQLSMAEDQSAVRRFISVRKHAGSDHAKELAEYTIDGQGVHVVRGAHGLSGILSGNVQSKSATAGDDLVRPLERIETVLKSLSSSDSPEALREQLTDARMELGLIDVFLRKGQTSESSAASAAAAPRDAAVPPASPPGDFPLD